MKLSILTSILLFWASYALAFEVINKENTGFFKIVKKFEVNDSKVHLGRRLFMEEKLSGDESMSCNNCHQLDNCGVDNLALSAGVNGDLSEFNSPSVFNAAYNFKQFWDGRAETLQEQAALPIENPKEMNGNFPTIIKKLKNNQSYLKEFNAIYPDGISKASITDALAEFQKSLPNYSSRFDQYLLGRIELNEKEKAGMLKFETLGCVACHHGVGLGAGMFQKIGLIIPFYKEDKLEHEHDFGRYNITKDPEDIAFFKVPSLRNVAKTAPYFHDGEIETLKEAIILMGKHQLGRNLANDEVENLEAFLNTLTQKECL